MEETKQRGMCDICKENKATEQVVFEYPHIKCACHNPHHIDLIFHCSECVPVEPFRTIAVMPTKKWSE